MDGDSKRRARGGAARRQAPAAIRVVLVVVAAVVLAALAASGCGGSTAATGGGSTRGESAATVATATASGGASALGAGGLPSPAPTASKRPRPATTKLPLPVASATQSSASGSGGATTRIVFVDVGQGDAAVIKSGSWAGLIDGGPAGSDGAVAAALTRLGVRRLDAVVVSHLHADHTGGLSPLLSRFQPRRALLAGSPSGALAASLRAAGTSVAQARRGMTLRCGAATAQVLSPAGLSGDANSDSVALLVSAGGRRILFTGDCTGPNEQAVGQICARGPPLYALKVSHHGSRYSTTTAFLAGARPRFAVISVGRNSYGHPSQDAVGRLRSRGVLVYSTQQNGTVTLTIAAGGAVTWSFARAATPVTRGVTGGGSGGATGGGSSAGSITTSASGDTTVYVTDSGECYHRKGCRYLSSSRIAMKLSHAKADGYRPCSVCAPPR